MQDIIDQVDLCFMDDISDEADLEDCRIKRWSSESIADLDIEDGDYLGWK